MIGDILAKLGRRETLTTAEQQEVRAWGNRIEFNQAFVDGIQNGRSDIFANSVGAVNFPIELIYNSGVMAQNMDSLPVIAIPQKYNHIFIMGNGRSYKTVPPGAYYEISVIINGDSGSNYAYQVIRSLGTALDATTDASESSMLIGIIPDDTFTAGVSSSFFGVISNYRSGFYKTALANTGHSEIGRVYFSTWKGTNPIRTIQIFGNFKAGSSVSIFCIG
jgi:hypothetical protein